MLILNAYDRSLKWTKDLEQSITARIGAEIEDVEFIYEDMDVKRNPDPVYLQNEYELLIRKHQNKQFDLIITTDDPAFNYIKKYHDTVYPDVPTIFSGVNYFEAAMIADQPSFTGVVESNDLSGTIDTALAIDPGIKNIIVINDQTETGAANQKHLEQLLPDYQERLNIEIWDDFNMFEIQQKVSTLSADTVILLLSFNQDRSNNSFSYDESIELIAQAASVPIYGVWDFYLGKGLLGGVLTSATSHGEMVGEMAVAVLKGQPPAAIPVVTASPNHAMFDAQILKKFNISPARLPKGSIVINQADTLKEYLEQNKAILMPFTVILLTLCGIVLLMYFKIKGKQAAEERERKYALTDPLTGMPNRRAGIEHLTRMLDKSRESDALTTVCFIDVDNLKIVNDTWGHREGDQLITILCRLIQSKLRETDLCCRFGGDEFLIVFYDASIAEATGAMTRIEAVLTDHNQNQTQPYEISISYGFAHYSPAAETSVDDLIEQADKAMYQNKIRAREAAPDRP